MAKVLIVEDSAAQAAIISQLMSELGHDVSVISDLTKGIAQIIKPINPDIVLLDLILLGPDGKIQVDGYQVCREIKRVSKNRIKVIVVSARADEDSAEWAMLQGADAFLQKPFAVSDLISVIDSVYTSNVTESE